MHLILAVLLLPQLISFFLTLPGTLDGEEAREGGKGSIERETFKLELESQEKTNL